MKNRGKNGKEKYYIAYGSNLNVKQMSRRCHHAEIIGTAMIKDYELLFKGSKSGAYLTIKKKEGGMVPVGIWKVTESDEKCLDLYEGFPDFYYKKNMKLKVKFFRTGKTEQLDCFAYIMHEDRKIAYPDIWYVAACLEGYDDFRFDERYLLDAINSSIPVE